MIYLCLPFSIALLNSVQITHKAFPFYIISKIFMIFHVSIFKVKPNANETFNFRCSCRSAASKYLIFPDQPFNSCMCSLC